MMLLLGIIDTLDNTIRQWGEHFTWPAEHVARLVLAMVCGGLVGIERELRGRQAGFRTNILVCVGSALVMVVSISFAARTWPHDATFNLNIDPSRIAYGIMTGVGFLGAGAIIKNGPMVRGLTTAAALWCVAAVGMAAGFGMYTLTVIATLLIVVALWVLDLFETVIPKWRYRTIVVRRRWKPGVIVETIKKIKAARLRVIEADFVRSEDLSHADVSIRVAFIRRQTYYSLERELEVDDQYILLATRED
jgi:putative Mg2+ transporter-C (MgtC) family protein